METNVTTNKSREASSALSSRRIDDESTWISLLLIMLHARLESSKNARPTLSAKYVFIYTNCFV